MYVDGTIRDFLNRLASGFPEPGGGSAAALVGALGAALVSMVSNLTVGKEKYRDVERQNQDVLAQSENLREQLQRLLEQDTVAYGELSAAYKMPRDNEEERAVRVERLQAALKEAVQVPLLIARESLVVCKLAKRAAEIGNSAAVSDAGVAALLALACAESAAFNVRINLRSIKDTDYVKQTWDEIQSIIGEIGNVKEAAVLATYSKIG